MCVCVCVCVCEEVTAPLCVCVCVCVCVCEEVTAQDSHGRRRKAGLSEDSRVVRMLRAPPSLPEPRQWGEGIKETPPPPPALQQK